MKTISRYIALCAAVAIPTFAATVEVHPSVRAKTAETLGIPSAGVRPVGVRPYGLDRAAIKARAVAAFEKNPVAMRVRGRELAESENDRAVRFRNESVDFEVSKAAGAEILMDLDRYTTRETPLAATAPTAQALERRSRAYIREQMADVNPGELAFVRVKKIMDSVAPVSDDGKVGNVRTDVANYIAIFERRINNVRVIGAGEKIRVYFSTNGEVIGHSKIWRDVDPAQRGARPVVSPGKIRDSVARNLARHPAQRVEIDYFDFGYLGHGRYTRQDVLVPVYFVGYKSAPEAKRVIQVFDAYTGEEILPPPDRAGADEKK